jgi:hypothetical protein
VVEAGYRTAGNKPSILIRILPHDHEVVDTSEPVYLIDMPICHTVVEAEQLIAETRKILPMPRDRSRDSI